MSDALSSPCEPAFALVAVWGSMKLSDEPSASESGRNSCNLPIEDDLLIEGTFNALNETLPLVIPVTPVMAVGDVLPPGDVRPHVDVSSSSLTSAVPMLPVGLLPGGDPMCRRVLPEERRGKLGVTLPAVPLFLLKILFRLALSVGKLASWWNTCLIKEVGHIYFI